MKLLLSTTGGRGGETDTKFAYTEKQQAMGDFKRTGGLQDNIRDFARDVVRKSIINKMIIWIIYGIGFSDHDR